MSEKTTWIRLPRHVLVGSQVLNDIVAVIQNLQLGDQALIVTSPKPNEVVGSRLFSDLTNAGYDVAKVVIAEASFEAVNTVVASAREHDSDFLISIGGGKAIDIAKMAGKEVNQGFISVPTAASHDGIVSGRSSVPDGNIRHSVVAEPPLAVVADTEILADAPSQLTMAGCADIISNYTAVKDWQLAERLQGIPYSEYAAALSEMTAEMIVNNSGSIYPNLEESTWVVVKALVSSGVAMSIAGSSRPASGAEHLFSHQLDRIAPETALHGCQVGVGTIMVEYLHSGDDGQWQLIRDTLSEIGAPTTAEELGISEDDVIEALSTAHEIRDRYTILGNGMSETAAREVAEITGVI